DDKLHSLGAIGASGKQPSSTGKPTVRQRPVQQEHTEFAAASRRISARRPGASLCCKRACVHTVKPGKERQLFTFRHWRGWWTYSLTSSEDESNQRLALDPLRSRIWLRLLCCLGHWLLHLCDGFLFLP